MLITNNNVCVGSHTASPTREQGLSDRLKCTCSKY